jgi:hypothetical protein
LPAKRLPKEFAMINRCGSTVLRSLVALAALAVLATLLITRDAGVAEATPWDPVYTYCLDNAATGAFNLPPAEQPPCDGDPAVGAPSDTRTTLSIPALQYNFGGGGTGFSPAPAFEAQDPNIPLGAIVGKLASKATLGLIGNPCKDSINVLFTFFFSSLDLSNTIVPKPTGQTNQLEFFALDDDNDGLPNAVEQYPEYLKKIFDPDYQKGPDGVYDNAYGGGDDIPGPIEPLQPLARATAFTIPTGTGLQVVLNFLVFPLGTNLSSALYPDVPAFEAALGYPSVTVLQDPTVPASPGAVSDFCSPLDVVAYTFGVTRDNPCTPVTVPVYRGCDQGDPQYTAPFTITPDPEGCDAPKRAQPDPDGNEASCATRKNPQGTYVNTTFTRSQRDADDDGLENSFDSCPFVPSPGFNPRAPDTARDPDGDGLPNPPEGCDPLPTVRGPQSPPNCKQGNVGPDTDGDCYADRGDNCGAVLLPDNTIDINKSYNTDQKDQDADGIGDQCETEAGKTEASGHRHEACFPIAVSFPDSVQGAVGTPYAPPCTLAASQANAPPPPPDDPNNPANTGSGSTGAGGTGAGGTGNTAAGGGAGGPVTGVGSLSPVAGSVPAWAAILAAFGASGAIGSLGYFGARLWRRGD